MTEDLYFAEPKTACGHTAKRRVWRETEREERVAAGGVVYIVANAQNEIMNRIVSAIRRLYGFSTCGARTNYRFVVSARYGP